MVTVYDVVVEDGVPWTVMQLVDGSSLEDHLAAHGPLSIELAAKVASGVLGLVSAAAALVIMARLALATPSGVRVAGRIAFCAAVVFVVATYSSVLSSDVQVSLLRAEDVQYLETVDLHFGPGLGMLIPSACVIGIGYLYRDFRTRRKKT